MYNEKEDIQVMWPLDTKHIYIPLGWNRGQEGTFSDIFSIPEVQTTNIKNLSQLDKQEKSNSNIQTLEKEMNLS